MPNQSQNQSPIELSHVSIRLGGNPVLTDISLQILTGSFVTVLGPNGAGKSTFLKMLLGLLTPQQGEIRVFGESPRRGNQRIGYAPQHRVLENDVALRARDVVGFGLDGHKWGIGLPSTHRRQRIHHALAEVDGLQLADSPIGQLSGGEQQRMLIAQAVIAQPQLLLLDEPFANLDLPHTQEVVQLLKQMNQKRRMTTILVAHDINPLLGVTDFVLYLANGHAAVGTPAEVITTKSLSALYGVPVTVLREMNRIFVVGAEI